MERLVYIGVTLMIVTVLTIRGAEDFTGNENDTSASTSPKSQGGVSQFLSGVTFTSLTPMLTTYMYKDMVVSVIYSIDCSTAQDSYRFPVILTMTKIAVIKSVSVNSITGVLSACNGRNAVNGTMNITLTGKLPGRSFLRIDVIDSNNDTVMMPFGSKDKFTGNDAGPPYSSFPTDTRIAVDNAATAPWENATRTPVLFHVVCMKKQTPLDTAFQVLMVGFLLLLMVAMGCKTDLVVLKTVLKRPVAPAIGLVCQFLIMPLVGFALTMAFKFASPSMAIGFFACGCAPGGGASNFYTYLLGGDVTLSVAMTTISNVAAIGTFPLWIFTLGRVILDDQSKIKIPYVNIVLFVILIAVPLSLGILLNHKRPAFTKSLLKVLIPVVVVLLVVLSGFGFYLNIYIFSLVTSDLVAASFLLPNIGFIIGLIMARLFRQTWVFSITIAVETGVQNIGIALMMVMFSFPPPDNVLAGIAPVMSSVMTSVPLLTMALIYRSLRYFKKRNTNISLPLDDKCSDTLSQELSDLNPDM